MYFYVGIDVSKLHLDICLNNTVFQVANNLSGLKQLIKRLKDNSLSENQSILVVCEATGGYERKLLKYLQTHHIATHVAHANKIRAYAKSKGLLAKTDQLDARLITEYASTLQVTEDQAKKSPVILSLGELLKRREQLQADKLRELARLDKEYITDIKQSIHSHIKWLDKEIIKIDKQLSQQSQERCIHQQVSLLTSIPAIGQLTALMLLAFLPELSEASAPQLAALVGVAPFNRDSGRWRGKRFIQGGRGTLRKALYMASVASVRWNPDLSQFYKRLRARGKPAKVALTAVIRKLIHIVSSVIKRQSAWQPVYACRKA